MGNCKHPSRNKGSPQIRPSPHAKAEREVAAPSHRGNVKGGSRRLEDLEEGRLRLETLSYPTLRRTCRCCGRTQHWPPRRGQTDPVFPIVDQRPFLRAIITQPEVLDTPLLLPGAHERWHGGLSRFCQAISLDQKEFALPQSKERLAALCVGTSAQHSFTAFRSFKNNSRENPGFQIRRARRVPQGFPVLL